MERGGGLTSSTASEAPITVPSFSSSSPSSILSCLGATLELLESFISPLDKKRANSSSSSERGTGASRRAAGDSEMGSLVESSVSDGGSSSSEVGSADSGVGVGLGDPRRRPDGRCDLTNFLSSLQDGTEVKISSSVTFTIESRKEDRTLTERKGGSCRTCPCRQVWASTSSWTSSTLAGPRA